MGSPLGPVLADIFLSELECKLDHAIQETELYARYVDDTLLICKNEQQASEPLDVFNSVHPNIKFTAETEKCDQQNFLDLNIRRDEHVFI